MAMKVDPARSGRKRILSSTAGEQEPDWKLCRLSMDAGRSPLRIIQQSRRRSKPALAKKSSLLEGCTEVAAAAAPRTRAAAAGGVRAAAAPPPPPPPPPPPQHQSGKPDHGHDTRAAAAKRRSEKLERTPEQMQLISQPVPVPPTKTAPASQYTEIAEDEYIEDILLELLAEEQAQMLETDFLAGQHTVTAADRAVVVDWLILVQHYLRLDGGTLQLAVSLMDRVLSDFSCPLDDLQLLGVACLWLAAKMEEPRLPSARQLLKLTMDGYTLTSLLDMELLVLHVTQFRLLRVHPAALVSLQLHRHDLLTGEQGTKYVHTCNYLLDLASCRLGGVYRPPSVVAASAIYATELLFFGDDAKRAPEMDAFACRKEDVLSVTSLLLLELSGSRASKLQGARKKFSSQTRYQGLALYVQLSPEHAQQVLLRHLGRPLSPAACPADLSQEF